MHVSCASSNAPRRANLYSDSARRIVRSRASPPMCPPSPSLLQQRRTNSHYQTHQHRYHRIRLTARFHTLRL